MPKRRHVDVGKTGRTVRAWSRRAILASPLAIPLWPAAIAAPPPISIPIDLSSFAPSGTESGNFLQTLGRTNYLLGDMGGLRSFLNKYGISLAIQETSEGMGNVTGGAKRGWAYEGLTQAVLQMDTQRAFGLYGGLLNISGLNYHGSNFSQTNLLTLQTASGIEADHATRLWEAWYQQKFLDEDRLDIKVGQQSLDQEFMVNQNGLYLINTMFGWPMLPSADLPGGGPAYPLSALGVRARWRPFDSIQILAGVFSGSPSPKNGGDPQLANPYGTRFPWSGELFIAELQYSYPSLGTLLYPDQPEPLARTYKIGFWYDTKKFTDQLLDNTGLSLANPASTGVPAAHLGDWAMYALADQLIWVDPHEGDRTINAFVRVMWTPLAEWNQIDFSMNAGLTFHEPIMHRDADTMAVGMGYTHVSNRASALDRDTQFFTGVYTPVRGGETYVEVTYQLQLTPWLQLQPDFQYVFNPGAGVVNPNDPTERLRNEAVFGVRTNILF
jgi:porin